MKLKATAIQRKVLGRVAVVTIRTSRFGDLVFRIPRNTYSIMPEFKMIMKNLVNVLGL
jgi:hypothetical protein